MLQRFLDILRKGEIRSLMSIARELGVPVSLAQQMAEDLTRKGYLWEAGADCDTPQNACSDCPVTSSCHIPTRSWSITDKGRRALEGREQTAPV